MASFITSSTVRDGTSQTQKSIATPTGTAEGDLLILATAFLAGSAVLSVSGWNLALARSRTGISSAVYWKKATTADIGGSTTVVSTTSAPSHLTIWVIREAESIGSISALDQGSGSNVLTFPSYTPSTQHTAMQIALLASSSGAAAGVTQYANNMALVDADFASSAQRTSAALAISNGWSETLVPGSTWTQSGTQYAITYTIALELALPAGQLQTPTVTIVDSANPSQNGASNGSITVSWPNVPGASSYSAHISSEETPEQSDFVLVQNFVSSPYVFSGLSAGTHSVGIKAEA